MNSKKAKQLRRIAEAATVGVRPISKILDNRGVAIINSPKSTRGLYRELKRGARNMR